MVKPLEVTVQAGRTGLLILEREDGFVDAFAADGDVVDRERQGAVHIQAAFRQFDDGAGLGGDQSLLEFLLKIGTGGEAGILFRAGGAEGETQRGGEQGGSGLGHRKLLGHDMARD